MDCEKEVQSEFKSTKKDIKAELHNLGGLHLFSVLRDLESFHKHCFMNTQNADLNHLPLTYQGK